MDEKKRGLWPGWETVGLIGRGSFGAVYKIQRDLLGEMEYAALKVISIPQNEGDIDELYNDGYDEESITSTFQSHLKSIVAEYYLMRKMSGCPNIVNCDDLRYVQHSNGIGWDIFIKMELLTPLAKALPVQIPEETVIQIAKDMCAALETCKKHGVVHRDIKPQNIFLSPDGYYKLGDFGIAKTVEKTMGGTKIGTYKYMAPEVYNNRPYGTAADIYSLGLVLYWMLNERRMPFLPLPPEKLKAGMEEEARSRRLAGETLPPPAHGSEKLKNIVLKACSYNPKDRYSTAAEMQQELNALEKKTAPNDIEYKLPVDIPNTKEVVSNSTCAVDTVDAVSADVKAPKIVNASISDEHKKQDALAKQATPAPPKAAKQRKSNKHLIVALMSIAVVLIFLLLLYILPKSNMEKLRNAKVGDTVTFGSYEQDNNSSNGKEPIKWIVLAKKNNRVLVISKYALDCKPYNTGDTEATWKSSSIRVWLNNYFFNNAFTDDEKAMIPFVYIENAGFGTSPSNTTQDKIFLLSISEAGDYFDYNSERICKPTAYAVSKGAHSGGSCWWWLRSSGSTSRERAANIGIGGSIFETGNYITNQHGAIRPVLWIELNS